jgi:hypothetical protein
MNAIISKRHIKILILSCFDHVISFQTSNEKQDAPCVVWQMKKFCLFLYNVWNPIFSLFWPASALEPSFDDSAMQEVELDVLHPLRLATDGRHRPAQAGTQRLFE